MLFKQLVQKFDGFLSENYPGLPTKTAEVKNLGALDCKTFRSRFARLSHLIETPLVQSRKHIQKFSKLA